MTLENWKILNGSDFLQETNQYLHSWADLSFVTYGYMLHMPLVS